MFQILSHKIKKYQLKPIQLVQVHNEHMTNMDNTDISIAHAIFHNNKAAKLLQQGDCRDAISSLVTALSSIKRALQRLPPNKEELQCHEIDGSIETSRLPCHEAAMEASRATSTSSYVFDCATMISRINVHDLSGCLMACNAISGIILWNLAISHHFFAFQSISIGSSRIYDECYLQKAKRFYETSYQIHVNAGGHPMIDWTRAMPILNNLALVNHAFGDIDQTHKCQQTLVSMIFFYNDNRRQAQQASAATFSKDEQNSFVQEDDMIGIVGNVSNLILSHAVTAQAA